MEVVEVAPTIVLVHGAFADSASWDGVLGRLPKGQRAIAFATPLRGLAADAAALGDLLRTLNGPVVLIGHSYGAAVMTGLDPDTLDVVGLVYVAGFALAPGESCGDASALAPGSTLSETLIRVPLGNGTTDTYIAQGKFHQQFCADLPSEQAVGMSVTQRPVTEEALFEASDDRPLWRSAPSWFVFGELDRNIPAGAHRIMAERAGARSSVEVQGASHVVGISHPNVVVSAMLEAAADRATATR
jgi:pimeloyl-ACP methyl ester carboxylesterase